MNEFSQMTPLNDVRKQLQECKKRILDHHVAIGDDRKNIKAIVEKIEELYARVDECDYRLIFLMNIFKTDKVLSPVIDPVTGTRPTIRITALELYESGGRELVLQQLEKSHGEGVSPEAASATPAETGSTENARSAFDALGTIEPDATH